VPPYLEVAAEVASGVARRRERRMGIGRIVVSMFVFSWLVVWVRG